ncbi:MAG: T9SS type A sorting domain-containing protein [candidate division WOR-3 bacterium]|nr:T9SS type A sorting domain-containing protein [candidate division WOR-3 bacterium]
MTEKTLQGEFLIDTTIAYGPAEYEQIAPSIAFDGTNYFVVWVDDEFEVVFGARVSPTGEVLDKPAIKIAVAETDWEYDRPSVAFGENYLVVWTDEDYENIFGARISPAGVVLDTTPITICTTNYERYRPSVTFGLSNFFVAWAEYRDRFDIYGTRISTNGMVLDPSGIPIDTAFEDQDEPAVSFDGTNYFVVWSDERSDTSKDIYGARIDTAGMVLDSAGIPISTAPDWQEYPAVTFGGGNFFVTWQDSRNMTIQNIYKVCRIKLKSDLFKYKDELDSLSYEDIYGARVSTDGIVLDDTGIPISTEDYRQEWPQVAFDGINYFVVWEDRRTSPRSIYGARINTDGIVLDPDGIEICTTSVGNKYLPSVVWAGANYFVVWQDRRFDEDIFGARVTNEGIILDPDGILLSLGTNKQTQPQMAFDGTNYLVVWGDYRSGYSDIYGARVNSTGAILDPTGIPISTAPYDQRNPRIVFGSNYYFVVWDDTRIGNYDIYGARVNSDGVVLDTAGILISAESYDQYSPQVAFGNNRYFIVWLDTRSGSYTDFYGTQVDTAGRILFPYGIRISTTITDYSYFQVIFGGAHYFVVWEDTRAGYYYDIYGARVDMYGNVLDPTGIPISIANSYQRFPQVVFSGNNYFVVWQDHRRGQYDIYGTRVTTVGTVVDTAGIPISTATSWQKFPRLVFDGNKYFVIWQDDRAMEWEIYGARVNTNGIVLDTAGIRISSAIFVTTFPQLTFDGTNYVMVWEDYRNGYANSDIFGAHVNTSGRVLDTFPVSNQPKRQRYPVIVHGAGNQALVAYEGWTDTVGGRGYNAYRIWGKFFPPPGIEEQKNVSELTSILLSNSPNPFRKTTTIKYSITKRGEVSLKIYDITGRTVHNLVDGIQNPGTQMINWNGTDDSGRKLPAGVYFYQLEREDNSVITKELILLR